MAGRPPKPTALKLLEGNPGKRKITQDEPKPPPIAPECPTWLHRDAKREWKRIAPQLEAIGILTQIDMAVFAAYCQSYARWKEAEQKVRKSGATAITPSGYEQVSAWEAIAKQREKDMLLCAREFGFTPASRTRVSAKETGGTEDEFTALLSK